MDTRIKLIVFKDHTLGYILPELPNYCQILHASVLRGAVNTNMADSLIINNDDDIRLASEKDFENFRVSFTGFDDATQYIYEKSNYQG